MDNFYGTSKKMLTKNNLLYVVLEQLIDIIQVKNICNQWINLNVLGYISKIELSVKLCLISSRQWFSTFLTWKPHILWHRCLFAALLNFLYSINRNN